MALVREVGMFCLAFLWFQAMACKQCIVWILLKTWCWCFGTCLFIRAMVSGRSRAAGVSRTTGAVEAAAAMAAVAMAVGLAGEVVAMAAMATSRDAVWCESVGKDGLDWTWWECVQLNWLESLLTLSSLLFWFLFIGLLPFLLFYFVCSDITVLVDRA